MWRKVSYKIAIASYSLLDALRTIVAYGVLIYASCYSDVLAFYVGNNKKLWNLVLGHCQQTGNVII